MYPSDEPSTVNDSLQNPRAADPYQTPAEVGASKIGWTKSTFFWIGMAGLLAAGIMVAALGLTVKSEVQEFGIYRAGPPIEEVYESEMERVAESQPVGEVVAEVVSDDAPVVP